MFFWYAYRLDIEASGVSTLAPNCPTKAGQKGCFFDDFMRHIQVDTKPVDTSSSSGIGEKIWPTTSEGVAGLDNLKYDDGEKYAPIIDTEKLFGTKDMKINDMFEVATKNIQASRTKLGDDKLPATALDEIRTSIKETHRIRFEATAKDNELVKALNQFQKEKGLSFTVESNPHTLPDGSVGDLVDLDKMAKQADWDDTYRDFQAWIQTKSGRKFGYLKQARLHVNAYLGMQDKSNILHGPPDCS